MTVTLGTTSIGINFQYKKKLFKTALVLNLWRLYSIFKSNNISPTVTESRQKVQTSVFYIVIPRVPCDHSKYLYMLSLA